MSLFALSGALTTGFLLAFAGLGVFVSFRVLRYPDLTAEGSFLVGAASTTGLIHAGAPAWLATLIGVAGGAVAGYLTASLSSRFQIPPVVAGILVATASYSVGLLVLAAPNVAIDGDRTLFAVIESFRNNWDSAWSLTVFPVTLLAVLLIIKFALDRLLCSEFGMALRAAGSNPVMAASQGINPDRAMRIGLALANGLVGLSGSLFAQVQHFADVNMGFGILVVGLASVFVGEAIQHTVTRSAAIAVATTAVLFGAIVQRFSLAAAYEVGLPASYFSVVTSAWVLAVLLIPTVRQHLVVVMRKAA